MKIPLLPLPKIQHLLSIFTLLFYIFVPPVNAQAPFIEDFEDIISNKRTENPATHHVSFTLPINADSINSTDYIRLTYAGYSSINLPTGMSGVYTGTPSYSLSGKTILITGITVPPGGKVFIEEIIATNPLSEWDFLVQLRVSEDLAGTIIKNHASTIPVLYNNRVLVSAQVGFPTGEIQIDGYGSPLAYLIFNENLNTLGTSVVGSNGVYSKLFTGIPPANHSFSFFGIDPQNRNTSTISVDIPTAAYQRSYVLNQLLSPTIQVDDVSIEIGEAIYASGSSVPNADITIFTDSPLRSYSTTADASGDWTYTISDTNSYNPGDYRVYSIAQSQSALQSIFSPAILYTINSASGGGTGGTACGDISEGDLNCDASKNLIDFSILMYYWGTDSEAADINTDGIVGLVDLSILMYYWGS